MGIDAYLERPLGENVTCAAVAAVAAATTAHFGARALSSKSDGIRELSPWATVVVVGAAYGVSWLVDVFTRKALMKRSL